MVGCMMTRRLFALLLGSLFGATSLMAQVPDPMRPAADATAQDSAGGVVASTEAGVQTVILRPGGKSAAVINGQYVEVGGKVGDKRVLKISESEIVLKGESGREVIKVMPAVQKVPARKTAAADRRTKGITEK